MRRHCLGCLLFSFVFVFPVAQLRGQGGVAAFVVDVAADADAAEPVEATTADWSGLKQLVGRGEQGWRYWDSGAWPPNDWKTPEFDDRKWEVGEAPLGYGDLHIATTISYGEEPLDKHRAACFRLKLKHKDNAAFAKIAGKIMCDDGAVVYLNGKEVFRRNMGKGEVTHHTLASSARGGSGRQYLSFVIDKADMRNGENVLAVSVHQGSPVSSDLGFDLELHGIDKQQAKTATMVAIKQAADDAAAEAAREAADAEAEARQAVGFFNAIPRGGKRMHRLVDGETAHVTQDGTQHTVLQDAIEDARRMAPGARFARAFAGDTLEKLAAMHDLPVERLRLLNGSRQGQALKDREIYCLGWRYHIRENDTLASVARKYRSTASVIAKLNGLDTNAELRPGETIHVPGHFEYQASRNGGRAHLQIVVYEQPSPRREPPFDPQSRKAEFHMIRQGDDLESIAQEKGVTPEFLRVMNGLRKDAELPPGRPLLIKYSVRPKDDATLDDIVAVFRVDKDDVLSVNNLQKAEDVKAGEPLEIPRGKQMGFDTAQTANESDTIYEVVLGETTASRAVTDDTFKEKTDGGANRIDKSP